MSKNINFFDLGTHKGQEIDYLIDHKIKNITIYAFEANPLLYLELKEKYKSYSNIYLHNLAIASIDGFIKLYKCDSDDCGSSIYKDKRNVDKDNSFKIPSIKFSTFLSNINLEDSTNILKSNIEGAEFDLFNDLEKNDLLKYFHLFLCPHPQGFSRDMRKIKSLSSKVSELDQLMKRNNIKQEIFTLLGDGKKNIDLISRIDQLCQII